MYLTRPTSVVLAETRVLKRGGARHSVVVGGGGGG